MGWDRRFSNRNHLHAAAVTDSRRSGGRGNQVPANSTVIAEWWAALHGLNRGAERRFAMELKKFPQVNRSWDLKTMQSSINHALSVAKSASELVALVDKPSRVREVRLSKAVADQSFDRRNAERRAEKSGKCIHNVAGRSCPLCDRKFNTVYISGGGTHWHLDKACSALEDGQEQVRLKGGEVAEVKAYGSSNPVVYDKNPCRTCLRQLA